LSTSTRGGNLVRQIHVDPPPLPGFAALAIAMGWLMATRCARLRRAGDRHGLVDGDPLCPASPRWRSPWAG
jgi:hypothetical protein